MKKKPNRKSVAPFAPAGPDLATLIAALQRQVAALEGKIDMLIARPQLRLPDAKNVVYPLPAPAQQPNRPEIQRQQNNPRAQEAPRANPVPHGRQMHKAICADCHKECEVPFKPSGDRPVYCKECFAKRRNEKRQSGNSPEGIRIIVPPVQEQSQDKQRSAAVKRHTAVKKPAQKKKAVPKKRKR